MEAGDIITMINYINAEKKICNGVGMQSHLETTFPSVSYYTAALQAFVNAGFEVQITELDVANGISVLFDEKCAEYQKIRRKYYWIDMVGDFGPGNMDSRAEAIDFLILGCPEKCVLQCDTGI